MDLGTYLALYSFQSWGEVGDTRSTPTINSQITFLINARGRKQSCMECCVSYHYGASPLSLSLPREKVLI